MDRNLTSTGWASWPVSALSGTMTFSVTLTWRSFVTALNSATSIGMDGPLGNRCAFAASRAMTIIARTSIAAQIGASAQRAKNDSGQPWLILTFALQPLRAIS